MTRRPAIVSALALVGVLTPAIATAEPRNFVLDAEHASIAFVVQHLSFAGVLGVFREAEGTMVFDEEASALQSMEIRIAAESLDTRHARRDDHLRSDDFLDSDNHPEMVFTFTSAEQTGERTGRITGNLTLIGQTRPVTLDVELKDAGNYPFGDRHYAIGISARGEISRSEWGMTYGVADGLVGDTVEIIIEAEFIREE
jgi:polyisoprenoid-binding protein YceI